MGHQMIMQSEMVCQIIKPGKYINKPWYGKSGLFDWAWTDPKDIAKLSGVVLDPQATLPLLDQTFPSAHTNRPMECYLQPNDGVGL